MPYHSICKTFFLTSNLNLPLYSLKPFSIISNTEDSPKVSVPFFLYSPHLYICHNLTCIIMDVCWSPIRSYFYTVEIWPFAWTINMFCWKEMHCIFLWRIWVHVWPKKKSELKGWLYLSIVSNALHTFHQNSVPNNAISHPPDAPMFEFNLYAVHVT